jgi:hypothetical protein
VAISAGSYVAGFVAYNRDDYVYDSEAPNYKISDTSLGLLMFDTKDQNPIYAGIFVGDYSEAVIDILDAHFEGRLYGFGRIVSDASKNVIIMAKTQQFHATSSKVASGYATMQVISRPDSSEITLSPLRLAFNEANKVDVIFLGKSGSSAV